MPSAVPQQCTLANHSLSIQISAEDTPFTLPPSTHWSQSLAVLFVPSSTDCFFNTTLRLSTNATYFNIPLICYDGRVKVSLLLKVPLELWSF